MPRASLDLCPYQENSKKRSDLSSILQSLPADLWPREFQPSLSLPSSWPRLFPQGTQSSTLESWWDVHWKDAGNPCPSTVFPVLSSFYLGGNASGAPRCRVAQLLGMLSHLKSTEWPPGLRFISMHATGGSIYQPLSGLGNVHVKSLGTFYDPHYRPEKWGRAVTGSSS